jgi:hypothetical protein
MFREKFGYTPARHRFGCKAASLRGCGGACTWVGALVHGNTRGLLSAGPRRQEGILDTTVDRTRKKLPGHQVCRIHLEAASSFLRLRPLTTLVLFLHQRNLRRQLKVDQCGDATVHLEKGGRLRARQHLINDRHILDA